jgi:hypothetical protein
MARTFGFDPAALLKEARAEFPMPPKPFQGKPLVEVLAKKAGKK